MLPNPRISGSLRRLLKIFNGILSPLPVGVCDGEESR